MSESKRDEFRWDVPMADETLSTSLPDVPYMSENFCYSGHDAKSGIAYYAHIGRWVKDPEVLRELLILWLPDGNVLWAHSFGRGDDCSRGPVAACERLVCEEPGRRMRLLYKGPMQLIPPEQIIAPVGRPNTLDRVDLNILFEGNAPTWYYPQSDNTAWAKWHTEQRGLARGTIAHAGRNYDFDGVAYRDHSRGPRYMPNLLGHTWIQGQFPEGDSFCVYQVWLEIDGKEVEALSEAKICQRDGMFASAHVTRTPRLTSSAGIMRDYELVLESELGTMRITGMPKGLAIYSFAAELSHFLPGIPTGNTDFYVSDVEQPTVFVCDGRHASGHSERSYSRRCAEEIFDTDVLRAAYARKVPA